MQKRLYTFSFVVFFCFLAAPAMAADSNQDGTGVYSLGEVVVSGTSADKEVATTIEVTADEIESQNAGTLDEALELLPGVDVTTGGNGTPRINIHGFKSRHVILLLNGIPMNSTSDGQFNPSLIPTENIAKIKLSYGTHSVLYGQGGLAGVINVITKKGSSDFGFTYSAQMDERGNHLSKAAASGGEDKIDYFLSISNYDSNGYGLSDDFTETSEENGGLRKNSDEERLSFFGNIGASLTDDLRLGLTLSRTDGEFGVPSSVINDRNDDFAPNVKYERTDDLEAYSSQVSLDYHPQSMFGIRAWGFVNSQEEENNTYKDENFDELTGFTEDETEIQGGTVQTSLNFGTYGNTVFSLSGEKDQFSSKGESTNSRGRTTEIDLDHELKLYTAALEYRIALFSKLDITAGVNRTWQSRKDGDDDSKSGYMVGAGYSLTDTTRFRASYARKIRFPTIGQYYDSNKGNNTLNPEQSDNYEAGITQALGLNLNLDASVFLSNIENYIEKDEGSGIYENNDEYEFKGIDVVLSRPFAGKKGIVSLGYSLLKTKDKSPGTLKDELQYRPEHKLTLNTTYTFDFGLTAHGDIMYVRDQYYYSDDATEKGELGNYTIVNIKLEQKVYKETLSMFMGVTNLLDEDYEESYALPQAGRTGYAGFKLKF